MKRSEKLDLCACAWMVKVISLDEKIDLDRYKIHNIEAVVDRIVIPEMRDEEEQIAFITRLTDSVETSLKFGEGYMIVHNLIRRSTRRICSILKAWPARNTVSVCQRSNRAIFLSTHPTAPAPNARGWVSARRSIPT